MSMTTQPSPELWTINSSLDSILVAKSHIPFGSLIETEHSYHNDDIHLKIPAQIFIPDPTLAHHPFDDTNDYTTTRKILTIESTPSHPLNDFDQTPEQFSHTDTHPLSLNTLPYLHDDITHLKITTSDHVLTLSHKDFPTQSAFEVHSLKTIAHYQHTPHSLHQNVHNEWHEIHYETTSLTETLEPLNMILNHLPDVEHYTHHETPIDHLIQSSYAEHYTHLHTDQHTHQTHELPYHHDPLIG